MFTPCIFCINGYCKDNIQIDKEKPVVDIRLCLSVCLSISCVRACGYRSERLCGCVWARACVCACVCVRVRA